MDQVHLVSCRNIDEAIVMLSKDSFRLLILDASAQDVEQAQENVAKLRSITYAPLIALTSDDAAAAAQEAGADVCVSPDMDLHRLLSTGMVQIRRNENYSQYDNAAPCSPTLFRGDLMIDSARHRNIGIEKEVVKDGTTESKEPITETSNVITITIPYDMTDRSYYQVNMYRHHDNKAERFPDANRHHGNGAPTQTYEDGHFYIDVAGNMLYLYAKKFSTYAISFDPGATAPATTPTSTPTYSTGGGSSDSDSYLNTVVKPSNGTVSVNRGTSSSGEKVTITIKPDTGYTVDTVTVSGSANRSVSVTKVDDSTYTYIQPGMDVKINVTFRATSGTAWADCPKDVTCPISKFTDADAQTWYHDGVHWALENGVMNGVGGGRFNPGGETSRAMVVTMLWRLEGSPAYAGASEFADVKNEDWYGQAVRWASAEGIVTGYEQDGGKVFNPNGAVTREQLATMLYRYAQHKGQGFTGLWSFPLDYPDASSVSEWAYEAMCWMTMNGVINGMDGKLAPASGATRAQVATMLMRYCTSAAK